MSRLRYEESVSHRLADRLKFEELVVEMVESGYINSERVDRVRMRQKQEARGRPGQHRRESGRVPPEQGHEERVKEHGRFTHPPPMTIISGDLLSCGDPFRYE